MPKPLPLRVLYGHYTIAPRPLFIEPTVQPLAMSTVTTTCVLSCYGCHRVRVPLKPCSCSCVAFCSPACAASHQATCKPTADGSEAASDITKTLTESPFQLYQKEHPEAFQRLGELLFHWQKRDRFVVLHSDSDLGIPSFQTWEEVGPRVAYEPMILQNFQTRPTNAICLILLSPKGLYYYVRFLTDK
jgi:hypothetical protein